MNKIYLRDCVTCGKYIAVKDTQGKLPNISLKVPVIPRRKSFKTCSSECSLKNQRYTIIQNNKSYLKGIDIPETKQHKINIEINSKDLRSRDRFIQFCKDNSILYNGNVNVNYKPQKNNNENTTHAICW